MKTLLLRSSAQLTTRAILISLIRQVNRIKTCNESKVIYQFFILGKIKPQCKAQVQLQMHLSGRKKILFCVASPEFENNRKVKILPVDYDENYIRAVMVKAEQFWTNTIGKFVME